MTKFDFDEWLQLAKSDPEAFEARRKQVVDDVIQQAPSKQQHRLRGLQWRVDMERNKYKDSLVSCQKVFSMMWNSVYGEQGLLHALNGDIKPAADRKSAAPKSGRKPGKVLDFQSTVD